MTENSDTDKQDVPHDIIYMDGKYDRFIENSSLRKDTHDIELMKKISVLAKSDSIQDRLDALDLSMSNSGKLPSEFVTNLLISLKKDPSSEVMEKAKKCQMVQIAEKSQAWIGSIGSIGEISKLYSRTFADISKTMGATGSAYSLSQDIAKILPPMLTSPIYRLDVPMLSGLSESLKQLNSIPSFDWNISVASPTTAVQNIIQPIIDHKGDERTLSEVLGRSSDNIISELDVISSTDEDIRFNYAGYQLLCELELLLRDLIHARIIIPYTKNLDNKIHKKILEKWQERKDIEECNPLMRGRYRLIDYSDFSDLKDILNKGRNCDLFSIILNAEQFRNVLSKLDELDPIRKKIAHIRPLTKEEFDRLKLFADDISRLFNVDVLDEEEDER